MSSPYEDDVMRLLVEKNEALRKLEEKESSPQGFFRKRRLARELQIIRNEIIYLEEGLQRYRDGVSWIRKKSQ